jgi:hypothetical protein
MVQHNTSKLELMLINLLFFAESYFYSCRVDELFRNRINVKEVLHCLVISIFCFCCLSYMLKILKSEK